MNIITDIEELNADAGIAINSNDPTLLSIKDFFGGALSDIKEEIEMEEAIHPCKILIHILPPMEQFGLPPDQQDDSLRMTLHGYSEKLSMKIHQAISSILDSRLEKILTGQSPN